MATGATQFREQQVRRTISWPWFREFIRWELAPYPGRVNTVIRMVVAATLVMIVIVTFRIPNAAVAGIFSVLLARENLAATWRGGRLIVLGFLLASIYTLVSEMLFRGYPLTHFFWVIGSLYLIFFILRTTTNFAAALAFAIPISIALPIWDSSSPSEVQVEGTLWLIVVIAVGTGATVGTEALYRIFDRSDPLITLVDDMLLAVQQVAQNCAHRRALPKAVLARVVQYQMIGTGRLRTTLQRQAPDPTRRAQRSALISLTGRLIALTAELGGASPEPGEDDTIRLLALAERIGAIRRELRETGAISASAFALEGEPSTRFATLQEMERTVALISEVFRGEEIADAPQNARGGDWWHALLLPDAFKNPEYQRSAFAGWLAASACYILYNALDWPGIFTSVLTCIVTAQSTVGTSLQAQFLRLAGFVVGGLVLGLSAQILILPGIDSIFGFALFFATGTAIAAWFATSSPRLSYFGIQIAVAFYFINLQDFQFQTDLSIARDKVVGVSLGILAMTVTFDRFGTKSDAAQLRAMLARNVHMLAQLVTCAAQCERPIAASQVRRLRIQINDNFTGMESQTDAARFEFEFHGRREKEVVECDRIQRAQPGLRSIYLLELSLLSHRGRAGSEAELTQQQNQALDHFLSGYSAELMHIAASIAHEAGTPARVSDDSIPSLSRAFETQDSPNARAIIDICQKMVSALLIVRHEFEDAC